MDMESNDIICDCHDPISWEEGCYFCWRIIIDNSI